MTTETSRLAIAIDTRNARPAVRSLDRDLESLERSGDRASTSATTLSRSIGLVTGAVAAYASGAGISTLVNDVARLQGVTSRLEGLTGDSAGSFQFLRSAANELSVDLFTLSDSYSKLLIAYDSGVTTIAQTQELTEGLANVVARSGAGSEALGRGIFGLTQVLTSGTVTMEDFRQVTDNLPGLFNRVADAAGKTSGELRDLISSGQLSSSEILPIFLAAFQEYEGAAAALSENITQTLARARTAYTDVVAAFTEPVNFAVVGTVEELTDALGFLADNADTVTTAVTIVGGALGVAFAGRGLTALSAYVSGLGAVAGRSITLQAVQRNGIAVAGLEASARLAVARAAAQYADAALAETIAQGRSLPVKQRQAFIEGQLATAKTASATATANLARAEAAAIAATTRLTVAQRAGATAATAYAGAQRAASGAMALMGGPVGTAAVAAAGLVYLATRQNDAVKSTNAVLEATKNLNAEFARSGVQALTESQARRDNLQLEINKLVDQIAAIQNGTASQPFIGTRDDEAAIRNLQRRIDFMKESIDELEFNENLVISAKNTSDEFEDLFAVAVQGFEDVVTSASDAQKIIDRLLPDDAKRRELETFREQLESAFSANNINEDQFNAANAAIDEQILKLGDYEDRLRASQDAAKELQDIVEEALPERTKIDEYAEKLDILNAAYERGGPNAQLYADAIEGLENQIKTEALEEFEESIRDVQDALNARAETPFSAYADEIELLNRAMAELPDEAGNLAGNIQRAFANLDFEIVANLTVAEGDTVAQLNQSYQNRLAALQEFHAARDVAEDVAGQQIVALAQDYADKARDAYIEARSDIQAFLVDESRPDARGIELEISYANVVRDASRLTDESERAAVLLDIERSYQEQLNEVVRAGEGTRDQIRQASVDAQLAGLINRYQEELDLFESFSDAFLGARTQREEQQAQAALAVAQNDEQAYQQAQQAFERNASEQNRIALDAAKQRADISEAAARREFEDQQKAQLNQARLSQGLAVINAYASGGNFLTGLILAGVAYRKTQSVIDGIKAQQFNGGQDLSFDSSGGSANTGANTQQNNQQQITTAQTTVVNVINNGFLPLSDTDDVIAESFKRLNDNKLVSDANGNPLNTDNIQTQNYTF